MSSSPRAPSQRQRKRPRHLYEDQEEEADARRASSERRRSSASASTASSRKRVRRRAPGSIQITPSTANPTPLSQQQTPDYANNEQPAVNADSSESASAASSRKRVRRRVPRSAQITPSIANATPLSQQQTPDDANNEQPAVNAESRPTAAPVVLQAQQEASVPVVESTVESRTRPIEVPATLSSQQPASSRGEEANQEQAHTPGQDEAEPPAAAPSPSHVQQQETLRTEERAEEAAPDADAAPVCPQPQEQASLHGGEQVHQQTSAPEPADADPSIASPAAARIQQQAQSHGSEPIYLQIQVPRLAENAPSITAQAPIEVQQQAGLNDDDDDGSEHSDSGSSANAVASLTLPLLLPGDDFIDVFEREREYAEPFEPEHAARMTLPSGADARNDDDDAATNAQQPQPPNAQTPSALQTRSDALFRTPPMQLPALDNAADDDDDDAAADSAPESVFARSAMPAESLVFPVPPHERYAARRRGPVRVGYGGRPLFDTPTGDLLPTYGMPATWGGLRFGSAWAHETVDSDWRRGGRGPHRGA